MKTIAFFNNKGGVGKTSLIYHLASELDSDFMLGRLKDYRSLIAMAQESRKPMFHLKPGDGAIGGHQGAVRAAYDDFEELAKKIMARIDLEPRKKTAFG